MTEEDAALGDHARGCEGRTYTCTCGYDDAVDARIESLSAEVERLRGQVQDLMDELAYHGIYPRSIGASGDA